MLKSNSSHYQDFTHLDQWLYYLENLHSTEIDLGLARVGKVAQRLAIDLSFAKVITVAGTNGKGTTCAFMENALLNAKIAGVKQSVAVYSSPHLQRFNERLRINKQDIEDKPLMAAFEQIEAARGEISLSYYEYTTLAALLVLMGVKPSYIILEVGLGGRLDATNIIDADIAVITTIDLDHQAFLGNDRESIGFEKAGIMRQEQDIVIGDSNVPKSVLAHAHALHAIDGERLFLREQDFVVTGEKSSWQWQSKQTLLTALKTPFIPRDNVATALMVLEKLEIPLSADFVNQIISITKVAGRTELIPQKNHCDVILDVGHNPQATRYLADYLKQLKEQANYENIYAVVAMLGDKDISGCLQSLKDVVDYWYAGALSVPRAASKETMQNNLAMFTNATNCFDNVDEAFKMANKQASSSDLILVFGSFFTVAQIRAQLTIC
ncbi:MULTISPECIES: bifunctional tetrahydrofolate synthase/dihydrofolate synthase [Colwellia]|uniref:Dihydrofolate synthase/folylpolyglutamate synthase n=1 Tax=Colwellia marinimaniae TaxID=1513592 RepID=A0ABQ0MW04_9GAMM|nr:MULTISPECIES: bifunctional tetrahydrofolate synthase/dihydrofolate synthase [Colwellia]GAW96543.1 bifunctional folylpolyglutamate synthase/dihydrofolate synthase [Colwellia marinimaniae]